MGRSQGNQSGKNHIESLMGLSLPGDEWNLWINYTMRSKIIGKHMLQAVIFGIEFISCAGFVSVEYGLKIMFHIQIKLTKII